MDAPVKFDYDTVFEICRKFHPEIRTRIDAINIISMMREKLSPADIQPLECTYRNDGPLRAADKLIEAVTRKPKSFVHFMYAVHKEGYEDIVDKIRDYLREKNPKLLNHLDEKLRRKGLTITSKFVMLVGPFRPESALDPTVAVQQYHHGSQNQASLGMMQGYHGNQTQLASSDQGGVPRLPPDLQPNLIHLPGNTNEANSVCSFPDNVVTDMPAPLFNKLSEKLCRSGQPNWKKLANEVPFLSRNDVINIGKTENPGEALLDKLGEKGWTVQQLAIALESAGLQNERKFLQENYGHQQGFLSSVTIQGPVNRQVLWSPPQSSVGRSQSETEFTMGGNINEGPDNLSSSATGQSFCEQHRSMPNLAEKQNLEIANENNFNIVAMDQSSKREVGTTNLNISGDADMKTEISKSFGILNISESQKDVRYLPTSSQTHDTFLQAGPKPRQEPFAPLPLDVSQGACSLASPDNNDQEILIGDNQHSLKMLNSNEDVTVSVPTVVEDDPLGKSANHNADIDRLHLIQEVHQQVQQQDLLSVTYKDIHNDPGHVTMQMDSQLRNDAETS